METWLQGLLCAELMVQVEGFAVADVYYQTEIEPYRVDEFDRGFQDYLTNYKFRIGEQ